MGFSVEGLGRNIFLFKFDSRKDKEFVVRLGPWLMDNALLALEAPKANIKVSQMKFGKAAFWVRFLDIPLGFQNKFMAKRLGNAMGEFLEAECNQDNFCWGESLRVKIMIDITKPLPRGIWIEPGENVDSLWIQAKYERLPDFCYGCGRTGHVVKDCPHLSEGEKQETEPFQFGNWLRFQGSNLKRKKKNRSPSFEKEESPEIPCHPNPPVSNTVDSPSTHSKEGFNMLHNTWQSTDQEEDPAVNNHMIDLNLGPQVWGRKEAPSKNLSNGSPNADKHVFSDPKASMEEEGTIEDFTQPVAMETNQKKRRGWKRRARSEILYSPQNSEDQVLLKRKGVSLVELEEAKRKRESSLPNYPIVSHSKSAEFAQQLCREP